MNIIVEKLRPRAWRTVAMHKKYETERVEYIENNSCPLCCAPTVKEYSYWRIVENKYPYDAVIKKHDMLVPKRHVANERSLTSNEQGELLELKETNLNEEYTFVFEALPRNKSVPGHHHLHLIIPKIVT